MSVPHYPARSRMIDMYLADVGRRMASGDLEGAEEAALQLPHLAVALASPALQTSREQYLAWCVAWVNPEPDTEKFAEWYSRATPSASPAERDIPAEVLHGFRLLRRARELPPSARASRSSKAAPGSAEHNCEVLLQAARKWYADAGRHDKVVQENLVRLGVLR